MEASLCRTITLPPYRTQRPSFLRRSHRPRNITVPPFDTGRSKVGLSLLQPGVKDHRRFGVAVECAKLGSGTAAEFERELEEEMNPEEEKGAEWMRVGRLRDKCDGRKGVVELLECLEQEAIMGEDQGKEPNDYNRRAQIFAKSSRVFQALKERTAAAAAAEEEDKCIY